MMYETHSLCVHFSCPVAVRTQSWCAPSPHGHNFLVVVLVVKHYGHNNICWVVYSKTTQFENLSFIILTNGFTLVLEQVVAIANNLNEAGYSVRGFETVRKYLLPWRR